MPTTILVLRGTAFFCLLRSLRLTVQFFYHISCLWYLLLFFTSRHLCILSQHILVTPSSDFLHRKDVKMPAHWSVSADRDLLLSIIEGGVLTKIDWAKVSGLMKEKGHDYTVCIDLLLFSVLSLFLFSWIWKFRHFCWQSSVLLPYFHVNTRWYQAFTCFSHFPPLIYLPCMQHESRPVLWIHCSSNSLANSNLSMRDAANTT